MEPLALGPPFPVADGDKLEERIYLREHLSVRAEPGYYRRYQASAAFPWLGNVFQITQPPASGVVWDDFIYRCSETFAEVMDNISSHAFNLRDSSFVGGWLGTSIVNRARSSLIISATTGGQGSHDRLHFLAIDNGFSIPGRYVGSMQ